MQMLGNTLLEDVEVHLYLHTHQSPFACSYSPSSAPPLQMRHIFGVGGGIYDHSCILNSQIFDLFCLQKRHQRINSVCNQYTQEEGKYLPPSHHEAKNGQNSVEWPLCCTRLLRCNMYLDKNTYFQAEMG